MPTSAPQRSTPRPPTAKPYHRVLLKISGESFCKPGSFGIDPDELGSIAGEIRAAHATGVQLAVVVGGGNIVRGAELAASGHIEQATADHMGMLGTVINALALKEKLLSLKVDCRVQSALDGLHVLTGGAVGFARGLNDTPKILALLVGAGALGVHDGIGLVAVAMAAGGLLAARRVAHTLAHGITVLNHGQGFAASLVTAALVTAASPLGLPVSTTHVACGALFGIGAVSGEAHWRVIRQVLAAWVPTLPAAILLSALFALLTSAVR